MKRKWQERHEQQVQQRRVRQVQQLREQFNFFNSQIIFMLDYYIVQVNFFVDTREGER